MLGGLEKTYQLKMEFYSIVWLIILERVPLAMQYRLQWL